jgi:hypothetical protein
VVSPDDGRLDLALRVDRALAFPQGTVDPRLNNVLSVCRTSGAMVLVSSIHRDLNPTAVDIRDPRLFNRAGVGGVGRFLVRFGCLQQLSSPFKAECEELPAGLDRTGSLADGRCDGLLERLPGSIRAEPL